jgi:hypothetical protein
MIGALVLSRLLLNVLTFNLPENWSEGQEEGTDLLRGNCTTTIITTTPSPQQAAQQGRDANP